MDANETFDTFMRELNNRVICETDEDPDDDDVPHSLLRYLETSRSRAADCEKLILEELGDFPASHPTEDTMNFPFEVYEDERRLTEQVARDTEDEENNTSTDTRLLPAPTETEALLTHNVSVCPNNEDEQKHSASEDEAERQKRRCEKMEEEEELKRRIERDFQTELKKMMEAEKLHQGEVELMGRRAQEKLDQELLLQQELMSDLQRRVQEERRTREEEQKRMKDEEDRRTRGEEKIKMEAERKGMEEEMRRKKEEERRIEEMKLKKEERKREEEKRRVEREEKRKREEEKNKIEMEKRKLEEMRMMKEGEEREKKEEEEEKRKREEERKTIEEAKKKVEKEKRKMEEDISQKKEEERKKREEKNRKIEEEVRITKEIEERKKQEETRRKKEKEEEEEALKKFHAEMRKRDEKEQSPLSELRTKEEEDKKTKEEPRPIEEDEKRKREDEKKTKEEEPRRRRTKKDLRQEDEEGHREAEAEIKLKEDEEGYKRKMEHESKREEKKHEEEEEEEEEGKHEEAEKQPKEEEAGENKKEVNRKPEEEITLEEKEEREKRVMHDRKEEERGANEPKEEIENNRTSSRSEVKRRQHGRHVKVSPTSTDGAAGPAEKKRLAWMEDCVAWSWLSLQNRSKQRGSGSPRSRRGPGSAGLTPLCPDALLRSTGRKSLQEVTSVTLEDSPGRGLSTLARCTRLRSLTLRRCGLRSLDGINQLPQLCHIDVQENDISFVDCENMSSLRVLLLGHNKLTSIHGLTGAEHLDVLDVSHNSITRIAGLESMRRLQRLSVDHNQLISTKGLGDIYTLLHLSCSHNHLASVDGLENSALLGTLDLRANSLAEPPSLSNQVLLRELHLDDNNISSLQGLAARWLPLMQHLSVAQNRITQLPPMSDSVSLANLDLRFNCMSELQNLCESLEGCASLREVHLEGNPLQQERGWRAALQRAAPGLRAIDGQQTDSVPTPPAAAGRVGPASGGFLTLCRAQLQQTRDLQRQHDRELSGASSSLDAVTTSCRHLAEVLQLAMDHRFAHEHGDDATVAAGRRSPAGEMDADNAERPEMESAAGKVPPPVLPSGSSSRTPEERSAFDPVGPKTGPAVHSSATKRKTTSSNLEVAPLSNDQHLDLQSTAAAVVIQQLWRKYRQKCGNINSLSVAENGGGGGGGRGRGGGGGRGRRPESGPPFVDGSLVGPDYAATVIQAFWRAFALRRRRRLASALAAVSLPDAGEDDDAFEFEEVDVDEFVFDEKRWTFSFSEDSPPRRRPASEPSMKPPEPSQYVLPPPPVWRPTQGGHVDSAGRTVSPETSSRTFSDFSSKSPASSSAPGGLSQRSQREKILEEWGFTDSHTALLMLKRARKMKPTTQRQKKHGDPSIHPAFRSCSYPLAPVEARNRPAQHNRSDVNGGEAERAKRLRTRAAHPDSDSESVHFLPEISSDVLNGGRVQLVADPAYTTRSHHTSGSQASDRWAHRSGREHNHPRRNSSGSSSGEAPPPRRVASAPTKRERISHRDNAVQLSGGWGGGKKRDKECK